MARPTSMFSLRLTLIVDGVLVVAHRSLASGGHGVGQVLGEVDEVVGLGHEVRLALELDQPHGAGVGRERDGALGVLAPGPIVHLGQAPLAQQLARGLHVAVRVRERSLGVHHACAGRLA
jgi:hypothetical protein